MYLLQTVSHPPRKAMEAATTIDETNTKRRNKWNLGSLFRRRKQASTKCEISDSSSETEEKQPRNFLGRRRKRTEKSLKPAPQWSGSANSLCSSEGFGSHSSLTRKDRRDLVKARVEAVRRTSSSEDDTSPNLPRFKSDDSLAHKKTRAARTERYLKRMSKEDLSISKSDIEVHHPQNWNATVVYKETSPFVRPVSSTPSPRMQHRILPQTSPQLRRSYCEAPRPPPEILHPNRSSSNISIAPNTNGLPNPMYFYRTQPPPPPPRDPQRKLLLYNGTPDYGFSRSRSDHSIQVTPEPPMLSNSSSQTQFTYLADKTPRSRRPIHVVPVPEQRHIGPEQRLIGAEHHIVPEQRHIGPEQRLIGSERHIVPEQQRHIGPEQRLIGAERHIGPEQRLIGAERHIVPEQRHIGSIHGQVPIIGHIPEQRHIIPERHTVPERLTISHAPHHLLPLEKRPLHHRGHEPSPECTMPAMPSWINDTPPSSEVRFDILKSEIPRIARQSRAVSAEVQMRTNKTPPPPPVRRYSRTSSMEDEPKRPPNNLEDALSELEAIYQSLRLGDEDLLDRAERRDLPTAHQNIKSDCNLDDIVIKRTQRAPPNRRSGIPDLVTDDMAYRRLNPAIPPITHDRQSGSYLLVSPTLSPIPAPNTDPEEPDTTFDDMSFRAIRTANSMKVIEHPPPFGIPLTPAPPAPDSDYLHVIPTDKFRPTLRPRKTPDIVKDDLAFRNLRKDNKLAEIKRKRAVRSLSANLMSLMEQQDLEKTQSLNCLPHSLQALIDNNRPPPSWVERANLLDSTETLTQSRANLRSLRNSFFADTRPNSLYQVQEDPVPAPLNEERLEEMLSALAKEAHDTSARLGLELERLRDGSKSVEDLQVPPAVPSTDTSWRPSPYLSAFRPAPSRATSYVPDQSSEMTSQLRTSERARLRASSVGVTPVTPKVTSKVTVAATPSDSRSERIARYKEERRKQLAAQNIGNASSSSGVESPAVAEATTQKRYISREDKGCISEPLRNIRTTRASRLRAAAATGTPSPPPAESKSAPEVKARPTRRSKVESSDVSSSSAPSSEVPSREGTPQYVSRAPRVTEKSERDKSSKRKSNLNRSLTEEPSPVTATVTLSSDSTATDDNTPNSRRRKPLSIRSPSMGAGCNIPSTLRTACLPQRSTSNPAPANPAVFQRLQCNLRPNNPPRRTPERGKPPDVSKRVDALVARTKEFEARMDKLASKKPVNLANNRASPPKTIRKTEVKENERNLQQDLINDNKVEDQVTVSVTIKAKPRTKDLFIDANNEKSPPPKSPTRKSPIKNVPIKVEKSIVKIDDVITETPIIIKSHTEEKSDLPQNLDELIVALASETSSEESKTLIKSPNESPERRRKTSILKKKSLDESNTPISILKHGVKEEVTTDTVVTEIATGSRPPSILKKRASLEEHAVSLDEETGILRRRCSREELDDRPFSPTSILKSRLHESSSARPILKKKSSEDLNEMRPILKKKASTDEELDDKPRPILKSGRRSEDDGSNYSSAAGSPARRSPCALEDAVVRNQVALHLRFVAVDDQQGACADVANLDETARGEDDADVLDVEPDVSERRLSVSERAQLFMRLSELNQAQVEDRPRDPVQRRERAKRFSTQPVTSEEVDEARGQLQSQATSGSSEPQVAGSLSSLPAAASNSAAGDAVPAEDEDEPSQLSLAERVRLFDSKIKAQHATPPLPPGVGRRRTVRRAVTSTRFRTLPVTEAEVEQLVSPLAASLTKPPDPGVLGGMSARAAREAMFEHASKILSKPSQEQPQSTEIADTRPKGILKHSSSVPPPTVKSPAPLQVSQQPAPSPDTPLSEPEEADIVRGILKIPASAIQQARLIASANTNAGVKSALKKESSFDDPSPRVGILKPQSTDWSEASSSEDDLASTGVTQNLASILNSVANESTQDVGQDLASILNSVANDAAGENASSSEDCDTSSSGGREVKTIIGLITETRTKTCTTTEMVAGTSVLSTGTSEQYNHEDQPQQRSVSQTSSPNKEVKLNNLRNKKVLERLSLSPGPQRSKTQPNIPDKSSSVSIAERLAALKHSGETEWKKRVARTSPERTPNGAVTTNGGLKPLQTSASMPGSTGGILAEKLEQLDKAAQDWKKRIGPNDAIEFSVAGRMGISTPPIAASPVHLAADRKKKTPKPARFRSRIAGKTANRSAPGSPQKGDSPQHPLLRSISAPDGRGAATVEVPSPHDESFAKFFAPSTLVTSAEVTADVDIADFEELTQHTLLVQHKRTVKMQRRRLGSRNPVKALAARTDLLQEYQEVRTGAAEREMKRLNVEKLAKNSNLAVEALAGLASKEDFTAVALKKATSGPTSQLLPYQDLMLLQVKGRRHVQTRLVQPVAASVNLGDSYVLVTPSAVYNWLGRLSNVIERTRSAEVAQQISQRKELGCSKSGGNVHTIDEGKIAAGSSVHRRAFWRILGVEDGNGEAAEAGHPDEDENFEASVTDTNMIYTVEEDELVPVERYWGCIPRIEMLDPAKVIVFDFGAELYIWSGKNASPEARKSGVNLARELWESGVDYSECDLSPVGEVSGARPSWALLGKLSQHMESALFREKFLDWPEFTRLIRVKDGDTDDKQVDASIEVLPLDVKEMLASEWTEPDLELEGSHLGRGDSYFDPETHRVFEVSTSAITVWHVEEFGCHQVPPESLGHFHCEDSFVVRWNYSITVTGRELSGAPSKHAMTGRSRCAYFFWQGSGASVSDQGAAALLTVELDREQGPHVRVEQGAEPSAFLRLFDGHMVTHAGHREEDHPERWRLYLVRSGGSHCAETSLVQVPCSTRQLRSRTSLLLLDIQSGHLWAWHGAQSHPTCRTAALEAASWLRDHTPLEFGLSEEIELKVTEVKEGHENEQFFTGLGGSSRQLYSSLPPCKSLPRLRMFHLSSACGSFVATEILSPARTKEPPLAFPFRQSDLYVASQPALFLLDAGTELWLWQGWWAEEGGEESAGSGAVRWQAERRAAMQTALDYWQHTRKGEMKAYLVWAGLEPLAFTNLFPQWTDRDDAAECNIQDGHKAGEVLDLDTELARLTRSTYPPAQLLQRPLPDGVDPTRLEDYLAPTHFQELLGMTKEEYLELPSWKQTNVKKDAGLF